MTQKSRKPVLLLGAYGHGNAGDDVFILSAAELFAGRTLYINSADDSLLPLQVRNQFRTISTVSPWDFFGKIKLFFAIDGVVYWGGDLWVKLYGTRTPRQLLYKMAIMNLLLQASGKRVYYIGCGIGDLNGYSRWLARLSGRLAEAVVVREQRSARVLDLKNLKVLPDIAINLPYYRPVRHKMPAGRPFSIVISVLWSIPDPARNFPQLLDRIAELLNSLPAKEFQITLLPMHVDGGEHDDLWASEELARRVKSRAVAIHEERDLPSIIRLLTECNLVIGSRLHANILAVLNATPSIGISYRPKVRSFFADNGLDDYCLDLDALADLPRLFRRVYDNYADVSRTFYGASKRNLEKKAEYETLVRDL